MPTPSNYPPGVSGNEPEIAGDQERFVVTRIGDADDFKVWCQRCDWHMRSKGESFSYALGDTHWEFDHKDVELIEPEQPEDVARTELDSGLLGIAEAAGASAQMVDRYQNQAQLHLLASIATSLYELRTRGLEAYEILTTPKTMIMPYTTERMQEALREELDHFRRAEQAAKERRKPEPDVDPSTVICSICQRPESEHVPPFQASRCPEPVSKPVDLCSVCQHPSHTDRCTMPVVPGYEYLEATHPARSDATLCKCLGPVSSDADPAPRSNEPTETED